MLSPDVYIYIYTPGPVLSRSHVCTYFYHMGFTIRHEADRFTTPIIADEGEKQVQRKRALPRDVSGNTEIRTWTPVL